METKTKTKTKTKTINYMILCEAFANDGWKEYHQFMVGNRWVKGGDTVTSYYGKYKLNGQPITKDYLIRMLHIDPRLVQVAQAIAPYPLNGKYGRTFLAGVRWADEHPAYLPLIN